MMSRTRQRGFRLANGSWKIICMRRRTCNAAAPADGFDNSTPSKRMLPRDGA